MSATTLAAAQLMSGWAQAQVPPAPPSPGSPVSTLPLVSKRFDTDDGTTITPGVEYSKKSGATGVLDISTPLPSINGRIRVLLKGSRDVREALVRAGATFGENGENMLLVTFHSLKQKEDFDGFLSGKETFKHAQSAVWVEYQRKINQGIVSALTVGAHTINAPMVVGDNKTYTINDANTFEQGTFTPVLTWQKVNGVSVGVVLEDEKEDMTVTARATANKTTTLSYNSQSSKTQLGLNIDGRYRFNDRNVLDLQVSNQSGQKTLVSGRYTTQLSQSGITGYVWLSSANRGTVNVGVNIPLDSVKNSKPDGFFGRAPVSDSSRGFNQSDLAYTLSQNPTYVQPVVRYAENVDRVVGVKIAKGSLPSNVDILPNGDMFFPDSTPSGTPKVIESVVRIFPAADLKNEPIYTVTSAGILVYTSSPQFKALLTKGRTDVIMFTTTDGINKQQVSITATFASSDILSSSNVSIPVEKTVINNPVELSAQVDWPDVVISGKSQMYSIDASDADGQVKVEATLDGKVVPVVSTDNKHYTVMLANTPVWAHELVFSVTGKNKDGTPEAVIKKVSKNVNVVPTTPNLITPTLSFASPSVSKNVWETYNQALTTNSTGPVSYSSSNLSVATVSASGVVTVVWAGSATITATQLADAQYSAHTASYAINGVAPDRIAPVITINGPKTVTLPIGVAYTLPTITAIDNKDGTVAVVTTGSVDSSREGKNIIRVTARDSSGNESNDTITVNVVDPMPTGPALGDVERGDRGGFAPILPTINAGWVTDSLGRTIRYSATGLPLWLTINSSTGEITGTYDNETGGLQGYEYFNVTVTAQAAWSTKQFNRTMRLAIKNNG